MAVELTGSWTFIENSSSGNQSNAITVPNDAELCVVLITGYSGNNTDLVDELSLSSADSMDFTEIDQAQDGAYIQAGAWYLVNPPTGNQTLYWGDAGNQGWEGLNIAVGFFKGVDTTSPLVDFDTLNTFTDGNWTSSLSGVSTGDLSFIVAYNYNAAPDITATGQTEHRESLFNHAGMGVATESGESGMYCSGSDLLAVAFAIKASSGGTIAIPVFLHHYKIAGGL